MCQHNVTLVHLSARFFVIFHVIVKTLSPGETFTTNTAAEWFLSCVSPHVNLQVSTLRETVPTHGAAERFLSVVDFLLAVDSHVRI